MKAFAPLSHPWTRRLVPVVVVLVLFALSLLVYAAFAGAVVNWAALGRGTGANAAAVDNPAVLNDRIELASSVTGGKASSLTERSIGSNALLVPDSTPPVITPTLTPATPSSGWYNSNVTVEWAVTDPESSITTETGCDKQTITTNQNGTAYTCTATNSVGLTNQKTVKIYRDASKPNPPKIVATKADGTAYASDTWTNQTVNVSFQANGDNGDSGVVKCTPSHQIISDQNYPDTGNCTDAAGNVSDNATPIIVKVDKTAPIAAPTADKAGVNVDGQWWYMPALNVLWNWADGGSGIDTTPGRCTKQTPVTKDLGEGKITLSVPGATVTCADLAGNVGTAAPYTVYMDRTAPKYDGTATATSNNATYGQGTWTRFPVTAYFQCVETVPGSGVVTNPVTETLSSEGVNQTITAAASRCKDKAGWTASAPASYTGVYIDTTAPKPPTAHVDPQPNAAGWNNDKSVTVSFTSNGDQGIAQSGGVTCTGPTTLTKETPGTDVVGTCTDAVGNVSDSVTVKVKIDYTRPVITLLNPPGSYLVGCDAKPDFTVDASISGDAGSTVQGPTLQVASDGSVVNHYVITAKDIAGNTTTLEVDYPAYNLSDPFFLPPVDAHSTALFNLGSVIPIKFQLRDCGGNILTNAVARLQIDYLGPATAMTTQNIAPMTTTQGGDTGDQFRVVGDTYQYNWKTKGLWVANYRISVKIGGVILRSATIGLR